MAIGEAGDALQQSLSQIGLKVSEMKSASVSALTRESAGVYTLTVTAGTDNETVTLKPSVRRVKISPSSLVINNIIPDAGQSLFTASPETILADGVASSTLTLITKNSRGKPLTGLKDGLKFLVKGSGGKLPAAGTLTESAILEDATTGTYTASLKGTLADKYTVIPEYKGTVTGNLKAVVTLAATSPGWDTSGFTTDKVSYRSGEDMLLTVTLKNASRNPVAGQAGALTAEAVTAGAGQRASLKLSGWSDGITSETYAITLEDEAPASINKPANPYTFTQASEKGTFPATGFTGAMFTIVPKENR
ncbi:Ig-like domain-containing protein [Pantoea ananatis]|uniref:Ig-like domain-containing protein n=1 Tax=Pantoea ananas TaxID=553 RepID=UPI00236242A6|nr:Ig-like domain-containing protein [Pantoea ananatis]